MTTGLEGVKGDSDSNYSCIVFSTDKRASLFNRDLRVRLKESTSLYSYVSNTRGGSNKMVDCNFSSN